MRTGRLWALILAAVYFLLPEFGEEAAPLGREEAALVAQEETELLEQEEDVTSGQVAEIPPPAEQSPAELPLAEDITMACAINGYEGPDGISVIRDGRYQTYYESKRRDGIFTLSLAAPEGKTIGGILLKWRTWPVPLDIQVREGEEWVTVGHSDAAFVAEYIPIPELEEFRLLSRYDGGETQLEICEIRIVTPGELPEDFQAWRKAPDHVDMMLIEGHPDDEVLWFGGLLPTYAGEQRKDVLVVNGTYSTPTRRLELLDCLWVCGVDIYPVFLSYYDAVNWHLDQVYEKWGGVDAVVRSVVEVYRRYRPDVVVLHAKNGESGHGAHQVLSDAGRRAVHLASDPGYELPGDDSEPWQVKKVYVHLWEEDQIALDWHVPLERFGGLDSFEVASLGFAQHISQQNKKYHMVDGGETDSSLYGLYYSVVGLDEAQNDMFEHLPAEE